MRRRNNTGSVYFDNANQKYYGLITDPKDRKRIKSKGYLSEKEAQDWVTMQSAALLTGVFVPPSKLTVGTWVTSFLKTYVRQEVRPTTWLSYLQTAAHLAPLANIKVQELTPLQVQVFLNEIDLASSTKKKAYILLNQAMKKAVILRMINFNPLDAVKGPKVEQKEVEIFTKEEINKILALLKNPPSKDPIEDNLPPEEKILAHHRRAKITVLHKRYPFILLAVTTGARLGELIGLKWSDFNKKEGTITIRRSMQDINEAMTEMPPKTKAGRRVIPLPEEVVAELVKLRTEATVLSIDGFIFESRKHTCLRPYNVAKFWRIIQELAGVPHRKFHALRHTHATELLASGVPILEVSRRLGHSRASHTLDLYGHAIPAYSSTMREKVSLLYDIK